MDKAKQQDESKEQIKKFVSSHPVLVRAIGPAQKAKEEREAKDREELQARLERLESSSPKKKLQIDKARARPAIRWLWNKNTFVYLIKRLIADGAIDDTDKNFWAALDGVFVGMDGTPIAADDFPRMAHQYGAPTGGRPQQHKRVDRIMEDMGKTEKKFEKT